mgnify:CR=1 FL=1
MGFFYISFIFLTAFAFLNMVIGIVVNVLEEESQKVLVEDPRKICTLNYRLCVCWLRRRTGRSFRSSSIRTARRRL